MNRRMFLQTSTLLAGATLLKPGNDSQASVLPLDTGVDDRRIIGIQVGAVSFVDEGTDKVLDGFQEMADINTLFLATFTYGRGIAGRQIRGSALPDHGKQEYDDNFHCEIFPTPPPQY